MRNIVAFGTTPAEARIAPISRVCEPVGMSMLTSIPAGTLFARRRTVTHTAANTTTRASTMPPTSACPNFRPRGRLCEVAVMAYSARRGRPSACSRWTSVPRVISLLPEHLLRECLRLEEVGIRDGERLRPVLARQDVVEVPRVGRVRGRRQRRRCRGWRSAPGGRPLWRYVLYGLSMLDVFDRQTHLLARARSRARRVQLEAHASSRAGCR